MAVTPSNGISFQHGFNASIESPQTPFPDVWLKLTREGGVIRAYTSSDNVTWLELGNATVAMSAGTEIGLFVNSHIANMSIGEL